MTMYDDDQVVVHDPNFPNITGTGETRDEALDDLNDFRAAIFDAVTQGINSLNEMSEGTNERS